MFKLYDHQKTFLDRNPKKHLLAFKTGLGKTYSALMWIVKNNLVGTLIICPKTIQGQWAEDIANHAPGMGIKIVTKEHFRDKWPKDKPVVALVIDEAHCVASESSRLHKEVVAYLERHNVKYRLLLTATPVLAKGSMNVYALASVLGYNLPLRKWREVFQKLVKLNVNGTQIRVWKDKTDKKTEARLIKYLQKIATLVSQEEVYKVPPQTEYPHLIPYTDALRAKIKEAIDGEVEHIVIWTKTHRAEQDFKPEKALELVKKYKRVILVARYNDDIAEYKKRLEGVPNVFILSGKIKNRKDVLAVIKNSHDMLKKMKTMDRYILIVNSAISEGYNLPHTEAIIYSSLDFSIKNKTQMDGRALRMDAPKPTDIHVLVAKGGSDENVYNSIKRKKTFNRALFIKKKIKRLERLGKLHAENRS